MVLRVRCPSLGLWLTRLPTRCCLPLSIRANPARRFPARAESSLQRNLVKVKAWGQTLGRTCSHSRKPRARRILLRCVSFSISIWMATSSAGRFQSRITRRSRSLVGWSWRLSLRQRDDPRGMTFEESPARAQFRRKQFKPEVLPARSLRGAAGRPARQLALDLAVILGGDPVVRSFRSA